MAVNVYKGNDTGAPTLDGTVGSLIDVLKACLVDGFGSKAAAGWTLALEDAPNNKAIFRNDAVNGTGRYFRVQDDGVVYSGHGGGAAHMATIRGCESYTDIDTTAGNFPNVDGADTSDHSTYYGVSIMKAHQHNNAGPYPWLLIADDRTCWLNIPYAETGKTDPFDATIAETRERNMIGFGDINPINDIVDPYSAFVIGNGFNSNDSSSYNYFGEGDSALDKHTGHYMNRGIEGNPGAIEFSKGALMSFINKDYLGGYHTTAAGFNVDYPSPVTGGVIISPIVVQEKTNAAERTVSHTYYNAGKRGFFRGVMSTPHTVLSTHSAKIGAPGDTFTVDGRDYILFVVSDSSNELTVCCDITGPW